MSCGFKDLALQVFSTVYPAVAGPNKMTSRSDEPQGSPQTFLNLRHATPPNPIAEKGRKWGGKGLPGFFGPGTKTPKAQLQNAVSLESLTTFAPAAP